MKCINGAAENLPDGFVADLGDDADLGKHGLCDDDGAVFTTPCTDGKGGTEQREPFFSSNKKGSFDAAMLLRYLKFLKAEHARVGRHFAKKKPGILFIDGCQTHLSQGGHRVVRRKPPGDPHQAALRLQRDAEHGCSWRTLQPRQAEDWLPSSPTSLASSSVPWFAVVWVVAPPVCTR